MSITKFLNERDKWCKDNGFNGDCDLPNDLFYNNYQQQKNEISTCKNLYPEATKRSVDRCLIEAQELFKGFTSKCDFDRCEEWAKNFHEKNKASCFSPYYMPFH